jgi:hypothetical protein
MRDSDWERVIVVWTKADDGNWRPDQLFLSQHSGYGRLQWAKIQNTFADSDAGQPRGGSDGRQNLDHAKVCKGRSCLLYMTLI